MRSDGFIRQWKLLVLLRRRPYTLQDLASEFAVSTRTIRRDLLLLESAGLPVCRVTKAKETEQGALWRIESTRAWPRDSATPVAPLESQNKG